MTYSVNEVFYSVQGEGLKAGTAMTFVRFAGCNLTCSRDGEAGFDCDTDFSAGIRHSAEEIAQRCREELSEYTGRSWPTEGEVAHEQKPWVLLTGGEPALQVDEPLLRALTPDFRLAIETNGTRILPIGFDWICVSPKTATHTLHQTYCDELKVVLQHGRALPDHSSVMEAENLLLSPAIDTDPNQTRRNIEWCIRQVKLHPEWRLSFQEHKVWGIR